MPAARCRHIEGGTECECALGCSLGRLSAGESLTVTLGLGVSDEYDESWFRHIRTRDLVDLGSRIGASFDFQAF